MMTEKEQAAEYFRRQNMVGTTVRRIFEKRSNNYYLSNRGSDLGSKTEILTRGKVTQTLYVLPKLPEWLEK